MSGQTRSLHIRVPLWLYEALEDDADRTGLTVPDTVRAALQHYLDAQVLVRP